MLLARSFPRISGSFVLASSVLVGFAAQLAEGKVVCKGDAGPLCVPQRTVCPLNDINSTGSTKTTHTKNEGFYFRAKTGH